VPTTHVLIVGSSARATAESAANAGFAVTAVDAFGDIDQHPSVRIDVPVLAPGRPYSAAAAARFARTTQADAAVYLSSFENHPRAVAALADGRALWGNAPAVLRGVRNPFLLAERMAMRGFSVPPLERGPSHPADMHTARVGLREEPARAVAAPTAWLVKPFASGGGRRVRAWHPGEATSDPRRVEKPVPADCYLQAHVDGMPGSLVFVAAGGRAVPIGFSRQLVGERAFGASGLSSRLPQ
jgi:predicted ATP-grasp superfamily ATP-dependent carboligase